MSDIRNAPKTPAQQREELRSMTPEQRHAAYRRGELTPIQLFFWANRFPAEPPLLNGELEWIAVATPEVVDDCDHRVTPALDSTTDDAAAPDAVAA